MKRALTVTLLVSLLTGLRLHAQNPESARLEAGLPFMHVFSPRDYRSSASNWAIVQDPRGVIYAGNEDGVLEYDGLRWRLIRVSNKTVVRSLAVDTSGRVWVGAIGEIGYLEPDSTGQMDYVSVLDRVPVNARKFADVWQTQVTPDGVLFVPREQLVQVRRDGVRVFTPETSFSRSFRVLNRLFVRERKKGLFELIAGKLESVHGADALSPDPPRAMIPWEEPGTDASDTLVVRQSQTFVLWDGTSTRPFPTGVDSLLKRDVFYTAAALPGGRLALGTLHGGLYVLDHDGRWLSRLDRSRGLLDDGVLSIFPDREGGVWLGLNRGIVHLQTGLPVTRFDERTGLPGTVLSLHRHQGSLYAGTSQGLYRLEPGPEPRFLPVTGIETQTWDLLPVGDTLLAASHQGIFEIQGDRANAVVKGVSSSVLLPSRVTPGRIYVGFISGVTSIRRDGGRWVDEQPYRGVVGDVRTLFEMPGGRLWAGTQTTGVLRLTFSGTGEAERTPKVEQFDVSRGLPDLNFDYVFAISGQPAFSTRDGVFRFDEKRDRFEPDPRFAHLFPDGPRRVFSLWEDGKGRVWMHSQDEVHDRQEAGVAIPQPGGTYRFESRPLGAFAGAGIWIIRTESDGVAWFGGDDGLFRFDPSGMRTREQSFRAFVRNVSHPGGRALLFDKSGQPESPVLNYSDNSLRFEYAAPFFEVAEATRFQVWLEGNDKGWSPWTVEGFREYTNLREGEYRFRVRARNVHGTVSEEGIFSFHVRPPWFRTVWAYLLFLLIAAGFVRTAGEWRMRRVQAEKRELEAMVATRTSELRAKNEELAILNTRLEEAQQRISRMLASTPSASEGIAQWSRRLASEITQALGATAIGVWEVRRDAITALSGSETPPPSRDEIEKLFSAGSQAIVSSGDGAVVPVAGISGELRGVIAIRGRGVRWGDIERRIVEGFAHQLGAAMDMDQLKRQLDLAQEKRATTRREMHERGIATLQICPVCGRCYDHQPKACESDGTKLESPRPIPYRFLYRYTFIRVIGQGGMGLVLSAHDERLDREVAVKLLRPEHFNDASFKQRFEREARVVARIQHPGIIHLLDSGELEDGTAYLVMEKLEGRDLRAFLNTFGPGKPSQVAQLIRQGSAALAAAHRAGVVHRDVKPENVFFVEEASGYRVKVLDFGLAKSLKHEFGLTQTGVVVGTPAYMAPEQLQGGDVDARADLYSFAAVAYEALTGRKAIRASELGDVLIEVLKESPPAVSSLVPGIPAEVDAAFALALAKDPGRRPGDIESWCSSFADVLERCEGDTARPGWPESKPFSADIGASQNRVLTMKLER